jgi:PPOX class probable F420-dependent enzyme
MTSRDPARSRLDPAPSGRDPARSRLEAARYASLRTFRADGTGVDTPVWFATEEDLLYLRTGLATAKIRRIGQDPRVELRPSDFRGRYGTDAVAVSGSARLVGESEQRHAEVLLKRRYGWQWNVIPVIPLPGLSNAHPELSVRERIAWARSRDPWPGTCVVRIDPPGDGGAPAGAPDE